MRVLLDESMPRPFARAVYGHEVRTVRQMGWLGTGNGELLRRAREAGFDALITVDRGIEYQQDVTRTGLGLVVLLASSNRVEALLPLAPAVVEALATLRPGQIVRIGTERTRMRGR